jgi:hypothetical protein
MANTYTLIEAQTLTTSAASVTFSAIPATYTDLILKFSARSTYAGTDPTNVSRLRINLNSDSSVGSVTDLYGSGSTATSSRATGTNYAIGLQGTDTTSNTFTNGEFYIPSYTVSQNKPLRSFSATENNGSTAYVSTTANLWRNTDAITSINLGALFGQIDAGSSFYLYGIKNS